MMAVMKSVIAVLTVAVVSMMTVASAHENVRIAGTIVKVHAAQLDVKALDGPLYEIDLDDKTIVTRDEKQVAMSEMRAGREVLVLAVGHDSFDLVAVDVQLSAPSSY